MYGEYDCDYFEVIDWDEETNELIHAVCSISSKDWPNCNKCQQRVEYRPDHSADAEETVFGNPIGSAAYERMVDFMRADLASNMRLSKIIEHGRQIVEANGRNFEDNAAAYKASHGKVLLSTKGAVLYASDAEILDGSKNRSVRRDPHEDSKVKRLYDIWISL